MKPYGTLAAIAVTYAMSAALHGVNFQLAAVLLSLGIYTYVEFKLRQKIASIFNACILANPCGPRCGHEHKWNHSYVLLFNVTFGAVAVLHLAYLGVMFEASSATDESVMEQGFSMAHVLGKWHRLNYASHWIVAAMYVFYRLI